jgi:hypothetical protein
MAKQIPDLEIRHVRKNNTQKISVLTKYISNLQRLVCASIGIVKAFFSNLD